MIHGSVLWLLVDGLACFRLTRLIAVDGISEKVRKRLLDRARTVAFNYATAHKNAPTPHDSNVYGTLWELVSCSWCVSMWIAIPAVTLTKLIPGVWQYPAMLLAVAAIAGLFSELV